MVVFYYSTYYYLKFKLIRLPNLKRGECPLIIILNKIVRKKIDNTTFKTFTCLINKLFILVKHTFICGESAVCHRVL